MGKYFKDETLSSLSSLTGLCRALETESDPPLDVKELLFKAVKEINEDKVEASLKDSLIEAKKRVVPSCFVCASPCGHNDDYPLEKIGDLDNERTKEIFALLDKIPDEDKKYALIVKSVIYLSSSFGEEYMSSLMVELNALIPSL